MKHFATISLFAILALQAHGQRSDFDTVDFSKADRIALQLKGEGLANPTVLVDHLTADLDTDVEKFRAIYIWVCTNISNDYNMYLKHMRKRRRFKNDSVKLKAWNHDFKTELIDKLVKKERSICTGYAYLLEQLSNIAGLNCVMLHGYGKTSDSDLKFSDAPNHSWNAIELNGKWYLSDPTWASGLTDPTTRQFEFLYNDGYFLTDPELFAINHFPLERQWLLLDENAPTFGDFLAAPILYGEAYKLLKLHQKPDRFHTDLYKKDSLKFQYKLLKPIIESEVRFLIDNGSMSREVKPTSLQIEDGTMSLSYQFNATGFYDVHLLIADEYVATYTVRVKA